MATSIGEAMAKVGPDQPEPSPNPDHGLVGRCRGGDRAAFEELIRRHQDRVGTLAHRLLGWPTDIEDVLQDVFVAAWEKLPQYRGEAGFGTWLAAITVSKCRDQQRRSRRIKWLRDRFWSGWVEGRGVEAPSTDREAGQREEIERMRAAMQRLNAQDREVLVLRYLEQCEFGEISSLLGIDINATRVRLHRAQRRLRMLLPELERE